jgi:hypothetical protein
VSFSCADAGPPSAREAAIAAANPKPLHRNVVTVTSLGNRGFFCFPRQSRENR